MDDLLSAATLSQFEHDLTRRRQRRRRQEKEEARMARVYEAAQRDQLQRLMSEYSRQSDASASDLEAFLRVQPQVRS